MWNCKSNCGLKLLTADFCWNWIPIQFISDFYGIFHLLELKPHRRSNFILGQPIKIARTWHRFLFQFSVARKNEEAHYPLPLASYAYVPVGWLSLWFGKKAVVTGAPTDFAPRRTDSGCLGIKMRTRNSWRSVDSSEQANERRRSVQCFHIRWNCLVLGKTDDFMDFRYIW